MKKTKQETKEREKKHGYTIGAIKDIFFKLCQAWDDRHHYDTNTYTYHYDHKIKYNFKSLTQTDTKYFQINNKNIETIRLTHYESTNLLIITFNLYDENNQYKTIQKIYEDKDQIRQIEFEIAPLPTTYDNLRRVMRIHATHEIRRTHEQTIIDYTDDCYTIARYPQITLYEKNKYWKMNLPELPILKAVLTKMPHIHSTKIQLQFDTNKIIQLILSEKNQTRFTFQTLDKLEVYEIKQQNKTQQKEEQT